MLTIKLPKNRIKNEDIKSAGPNGIAIKPSLLTTVFNLFMVSTAKKISAIINPNLI